MGRNMTDHYRNLAIVYEDYETNPETRFVHDDLLEAGCKLARAVLDGRLVVPAKKRAKKKGAEVRCGVR